MSRASLLAKLFGTRQDDQVDSVFGSVPPGVVLPFGGSSAPSGWLLCYGQSLLRADYPDLFAVIGTTFGAADGTHFTLPDMRGRVAAGKDNMGGTAAGRLTTISNNLGSAGGAETHTLSTAQIPSHNHTLTDPGHTHTQDCSVRLPSNGNNFNTPFNGGGTNALPTNSSTTGITIAAAGGGAAHNNTQPTIVLNSIIKT